MAKFVLSFALESFLFLLLLICLLLMPASTRADDILGCNGFVKSDIDINFSKVEVKLFTKQGSLKDQTECAPNNGYYFLPLYDKGEYVLKVVPPAGWSFDPLEVPLSVDGVSDPCSQGKDINFIFKGFAVSGKVVSAGHKEGPAGVRIELYHESRTAPVAETATTQGGHFLFTPVAPGRYLVHASHPRWKVKQNTAQVVVDGGNGEVGEGKLSVAGYDVSGTVTSDGQPITGVSFVLFTNSSASTVIPVAGCDNEPLAGFTGAGVGSATPLCHVASDSKGHFTFPELPPGDYILVPYYTTATRSTKFHVHPNKLTFTVQHSSLTLSTNFQVRGFTVSGRVMWSEGGKPMAGAVILVDNKPVTKTTQDGVYHLESMKAGTYNLQVQAPGVKFSVSEVKVTGVTLGDIVPDKYMVCGRLTPPLPNIPILVSSAPPLTTDDNGSFCLFLAKGEYKVNVQLPEDLKGKGLQFSPESRVVKVMDSTIEGVNFSQLKCTVKGRIECMTLPCPLITVNLKPRASGNALHAIAKGGVYEFKDIVPGEYDVYIEPGLGWCWTKETIPLSVMAELTHAESFTHSGYTVTIVSSHTTKVVYFSKGGRKGEEDKAELTVGPGSTHVCVPHAGPYVFQPVSCHGYKEPLIQWGGTGPVVLTALTHANIIALQSTHTAEDLVITAVSSEDSNNKQRLKPTVVAKKGGGEGEGVRYEVRLDLKAGEKVNLVPSASLLLFSPQSADILGADDCVSPIEPLFTAERGHVMSGRVTTGGNKGLGDVTVSVTDEQGAVVLASQSTAHDGTYSFPPLSMANTYRVVAVKEGYVVTAVNNKGDFNAHKLAEIIVTVTDKNDGLPLQGVLLSLSGGESYRRNAQTNTNGTMSFISLSPGEYYLRPMMKEYRFAPASKMIDVKEGATFKLSLSGTRVAFSGLGQVTSLNGEGEAGVVVEAVGVANCSLLQEDATSGPTGQFRIRGLQPYCVYNVRVKEGADLNQHIHKSTPDTIPIQVGTSDVDGIRLFALRPSVRTDLAVLVVPDNAEDLRSLRVKLSREESPDTALYIAKLSELKPTAGYSLRSAMVSLPSVSADGRGYIVKLECGLSQATHAYTLRPVHFKADVPMRVLKLRFSPRPRAPEPDVSQPSYVALPLVLLCLMAYYYRDAVVTLLTLLMNARIGPAPRTSASDDSGSDTFLEPAHKKKSKSKKA